MAQTNHITFYRGEDIILQFTMDPVQDITGWTLLFTLKADAQDPTALVSKAGSIVSAPNGVFSVSLSSSDTNLTPAQYVYDVWRTDAGSKAVLSKGTFTIEQGVRVA